VPELELVAAAVAGDRDAFRRIVEAESPAVYRICHRILGSVEEAEDAVQESFVIAYRALDTYRGDGPLGAWLARIAARHAFRRVARARLIQPLATALDDPVSDSTDADPLRRALESEQNEAVRLAVAALPEPYREVVTLRFFGELSLAEIALATNRPLGTVKTHLHRGLARVRESLAEEMAA
jgi:RNA polymerase sigma-70 factor (ECF subfamily)